MSKCRTCLVHHVDKGLCVIPKEGMDRVTRIDRLDQGGKFMRSECLFNYTCAGWSVEIGKEKELESS